MSGAGETEGLGGQGVGRAVSSEPMNTNESISLATRRTHEEREEAWLCPLATRASESLGRRVLEEDSCGLRTCFQRDKDRVIHSTAFRRLEYKTQVFVNHEGDYYRTRLTHTLEVAQIARSIARTLRLNEDLVEAVALGHDLGHTPFGHAGERTLNGLMEDCGGFEHNAQALRIVDVLEDRYPEVPGLNLTAEVRTGLLKDKPAFPGEGEKLAPRLPIEAHIVDIADEIAYNSHDCDDGLESGLLTPDVLREVRLWREVEAQLCDENPGIPDRKLRIATVRALIDLQVQDVTTETLERMREANRTDLDGTPAPAIPDYSPDMKRRNEELKTFLRAELYTHPRVVNAMGKSTSTIERLFRVYIEDPGRLPVTYARRIEEFGKARVVADYVAGMTDRYAETIDQMFSHS